MMQIRKDFIQLLSRIHDAVENQYFNPVDNMLSTFIIAFIRV